MEFKGVSHTATVYLDDVEIASHYNAYTAFDKHDLFRYGHNSIDIKNQKNIDYFKNALMVNLWKLEISAIDIYHYHNHLINITICAKNVTNKP